MQQSQEHETAKFYCLGNDKDLVNVDIELRLIMSTQEIDLI